MTFKNANTKKHKNSNNYHQDKCFQYAGTLDTIKKLGKIQEEYNKLNFF